MYTQMIQNFFTFSNLSYWRRYDLKREKTLREIIDMFLFYSETGQ